MLPYYFKPYFWDVNFDKLNIKEKREFIVSRVLEKGSDKAIRWVFSQLNIEEIKRIVLINLNLSDSTFNLWSRVLDLNESTIQKCY